MTKHIDLNELNKMAGGNCRSIGEMFGKIAAQNKDKETTVNGVKVTALSANDSKKIINMFHTED